MVKQVYIGSPLQEKLRGMKCLVCHNELAGNFAYYPETYYVDGELYNFSRDTVIPDDNDSFVKMFYGIYA